MTSQSPGLRRPVRLFAGLCVAALLAVAGFGAAASASAPAVQPPAAPPAQKKAPAPPPLPAAPDTMPAPVAPIVSMTAPAPDPRVGLKAGIWDAGQAAWNLRMISTTPPKGKVLGATHSDLAFFGKYAIQGNYDGFEIYDISDPTHPVLVQSYLCPASQNDVSVYRNLLFMSSEATNSRARLRVRRRARSGEHRARAGHPHLRHQRPPEAPAREERADLPRFAHAHRRDAAGRREQRLHLRVGTAGVRSDKEMPGCEDGGVDDPNSARFRLEVIKVPLAHPEMSAIVSSPRIFESLPVPPRDAQRDAIDKAAREAAEKAREARGEAPRPPRPHANDAPTGPNQCHDITVYPQVGLAGGACAGLGLLLDIHDAAHPVRIAMASDSNMSFWHSATFSNDGTKILFTDEWGGGSQPRCRATDKMEWGADALFTIENKKLVFHGYYKMPAAQTEQENCVAHNGSLIPIPGREVMVQSWYQGGISIFDWTDVKHPKEIAYFDRGPMNADRLIMAGSWSAYWYNGVIVSSEIARGLDIYELVPSGLISENELAAARTVKFDRWNTQDQQKIVWPPSFPLVRAYLDQLERSHGLADSAIASARTTLTSAEQKDAAARKTELTSLASQMRQAAAGSHDQKKVQTLSAALTDLANAQQ